METDVPKAAAASDIHANCVDIIQVQSPNHPRGHSFPKRTFGKTSKKECFFLQSSWIGKYSWLHHDEKSDRAFCFLFIKAHQQRTKLSSKFNKAFTPTGFTNWTGAGRKFSTHKASDTRKDAHRARFSNTEDMEELMCDIHAGQKRKNKHCFLKILSSVGLLAR